MQRAPGQKFGEREIGPGGQRSVGERADEPWPDEQRSRDRGSHLPGVKERELLLVFETRVDPDARRAEQLGDDRGDGSARARRSVPKQFKMRPRRAVASRMVVVVDDAATRGVDLGADAGGLVHEGRKVDPARLVQAERFPDGGERGRLHRRFDQEIDPVEAGLHLDDRVALGDGRRGASRHAHHEVDQGARVWAARDLKVNVISPVFEHLVVRDAWSERRGR